MSICDDWAETEKWMSDAFWRFLQNCTRSMMDKIQMALAMPIVFVVAENDPLLFTWDRAWTLDGRTYDGVFKSSSSSTSVSSVAVLEKHPHSSFAWIICWKRWQFASGIDPSLPYASNSPQVNEPTWSSGFITSRWLPVLSPSVLQMKQIFLMTSGMYMWSALWLLSTQKPPRDEWPFRTQWFPGGQDDASIAVRNSCLLGLHSSIPETIKSSLLCVTFSPGMWGGWVVIFLAVAVFAATQVGVRSISDNVRKWDSHLRLFIPRTTIVSVGLDCWVGLLGFPWFAFDCLTLTNFKLFGE